VAGEQIEELQIDFLEAWLLAKQPEHRDGASDLSVENQRHANREPRFRSCEIALVLAAGDEALAC
jgi:hypothetical protein